MRATLRLPGVVVALAATVAFAPHKRPAGRFRAGLCRDSSQIVVPVLALLRSLSATTDTQQQQLRSALFLSATTPSSISVVTDTTICRRAAESLQRRDGATGEPAAVHLVRYDATRYFGSNQGRLGDWKGWYVLDGSLAVLGAVRW